jgi:HlyD family secretion protein
MTHRAFPFALPVVLVLALFAVACGDDDRSDAYGNFEATETTVSAEARGRLLELSVREGDPVEAGQVVGRIESSGLEADREALVARRQSLESQRTVAQTRALAARARIAEAEAAAGALAAQLDTARRELERTRRLFEDRAATERELSERQGRVAELEERLEQARAGAAAARAEARVPEAEAGAVDAQVAEVDARIRQAELALGDAEVENPAAGTVVTVLAEVGETVAFGAPLYTVADLDPITLRAYVTGEQLPGLRLGQEVTVLTDEFAEGPADALERRPGRVVWIAREAQFTPTPIQTRDERAELVYAFDVQVPNPDGRLKIGMPGEVLWSTLGSGTP